MHHRLRVPIGSTFSCTWAYWALVHRGTVARFVHHHQNLPSHPSTNYLAPHLISFRWIISAVNIMIIWDCVFADFKNCSKRRWNGSVFCLCSFTRFRPQRFLGWMKPHDGGLLNFYKHVEVCGFLAKICSALNTHISFLIRRSTLPGSPAYPTPSSSAAPHRDPSLRALDHCGHRRKICRSLR